MPFPKNAVLSGTPITILGPHVSVKHGKWECSYTDVIAELGGVTFLAPISDLEDVEITDAERDEIDQAVATTFPEVERLARVLTGQH